MAAIIENKLAEEIIINHEFLMTACANRGIKNPNQLVKLTGLNNTVIYPLWNGEANDMKLSSVAILCQTLQVSFHELLTTRKVEQDESQA